MWIPVLLFAWVKCTQTPTSDWTIKRYGLVLYVIFWAWLQCCLYTWVNIKGMYVWWTAQWQQFLLGGEASLCRSKVNPLLFLAIYPGPLYQEHNFDCNGCAHAHFVRRDIVIPSTCFRKTWQTFSRTRGLCFVLQWVRDSSCCIIQYTQKPWCFSV